MYTKEFLIFANVTHRNKSYSMNICKVGIIGAGSIAQKMADTLNRMENAIVYGIASRQLEKARSFADKFNVPHAYGSYEELVADSEVDLVYIATPHSLHYEHARLCIEHGKPVLCEKAFTANARQAKALLKLAKEKKVFITEAIWTRFMPLSKTIRQLLDDGIIGTPSMLTAGLSYAVAHKERLFKPELAGGALLDLGVYPINFALMAFGNDVENITSACVKNEYGVDAQNSITFRFKDGKMAVMQSSMLCAGDRHGVISGDKGYIIVDNINNPQQATVYSKGHEIIKQFHCPPQISGYEYEVEASIKALQEGALETRDMPHEETLRIMQILDELRSEWGVQYPMDIEPGNNAC